MVFVKLIGGKIRDYFRKMQIFYNFSCFLYVFLPQPHPFTKTIALEKHQYYLVFPTLIRTFARRTTKANIK